MSMHDAYESARSRIPPEIVHEIVAHNADDVSSLRAMSLASKTTRTFAIEHLFSVIHFACAQDITLWKTMVRRTPKLQTIVKKVKFSEVDRLNGGRMVRARKDLRDAAVPPKIPVMPNVRVVEWSANVFPAMHVPMAVAYLGLFPNIQELYLSGLMLENFDHLATLLAACGRIRVLSLCDMDDAGEDDSGMSSQSTPAKQKRRNFDLTALEELVITDCGDLDEADYVVQLVEQSRPAGLKSLTFVEGLDGNEACSILAMETLLRLAVPSLADLAIMLYEREMGGMFKRLPTFLALTMLSIWLPLGSEARPALDSLPVAPNLTALNFRIRFDDDEGNFLDFRELLDGLPWDDSESMKSVLTRRFPLIRRIGFYFCAPRNSVMHFRRGFRRKMERQVARRHVQASGVQQN
ncbi:hypothetical protein DFH06DRAFT_1208015 [Mycena polygramma]|nr:hypothetical protein DFH06DRAFT_1208015 [Mycena polygramma]